MELKDRLKQARKIAKKSQKEVAAAVGITQPTLSQLESGLVNSSTYLPSIAKYLNVDAYWLQTGLGSPSIVKKDLSFENVSINESPLYKIPILDFVQAGLFHESGYDGINPKGEAYTTYKSCRPESVFSLEVAGLSMSPDFMPGDKLVVDSAKEPYPGCYVIAQNGSHEATFKKYRVTGYDEHGRETFELVPLNPDFPTINSIQHDIRIIGVVVEQLKSFKK
ncbi:LexA family protein [Acinetobacter baumannii]|uniref:LexA family protein n=1 Tax=Acinetobacter baumannii TaxID=470 RepID=UPI0019D019DB|nr:S24 family peptidase [Acinetobacter baumannii]MDH2661891.1 S24 family peptidase [Acinetobacter baumannii]UNI12398.1 helix-turn-helix domain-containing protein [Acinetobacter baumannii]HEC0059779.1 helix-turn-helix transcriptional regulator [Acinetobacter baumannii]HEC0123075.1 helix-turn-helix transcriptional regulator [Acinetobacter baumannii]HEC0348162.1 helix-turn-helix transcriptional regulator [Acinetobacter baumannii]